MNTTEVSMPQPLIVTEKATEAAGHRDPARDDREGTVEAPGGSGHSFSEFGSSQPQ
jgi:hypothetical protein